MRITELVGTPRGDFARVSVRSDSGLVGVGEAFIPGRVGAAVARLEDLAPSLLGTDPFTTEALIDRLLTREPGRPGDVEMAAVSMIEIACRDLVGREFGQPVYQLIGGLVRESIPVCAVGWASESLNLDGLARAAREVVARGFHTLAFDPFGTLETLADPSPAMLRDALRRAEAVRAAVGPDLAIRIDLNVRLSPGLASRFIRSLDRVDPIGITDPVSTGHRLNLRAEFASLLIQRPRDLIRFDLTRCGGFTEAKKIASLAETHGVLVALRAVGGPVATPAALHLAATLPNLAYVEIEPGNLETVIVGGACGLPSWPGLGVGYQGG